MGTTELAAPFGLSPSGAIAVLTTPADQVQAHLTALVSTGPGERVMLPTYGVPLASLVFGDTAGVVVQQVSQDVQQAIGKWEPSVNLIDVRLDVSDTPEGMAGVTVEYSPGQEVTSTATVSTATVLVGGTVIGNS
jgi:uncharacterized protein